MEHGVRNITKYSRQGGVDLSEQYFKIACNAMVLESSTESSRREGILGVMMEGGVNATNEFSAREQ